MDAHCTIFVAIFLACSVIAFATPFPRSNPSPQYQRPMGSGFWDSLPGYMRSLYWTSSNSIFLDVASSSFDFYNSQSGLEIPHMSLAIWPLSPWYWTLQLWLSHVHIFRRRFLKPCHLDRIACIISCCWDMVRDTSIQRSCDI